VEAERLPDARALADRKRAALLVDADEAADEEVPPPVLGLVLVDHEAGEEPPRDERLLRGRQRRELLPEALERRLPRELEDDVLLRVRDDRVVAHRRATLRDDRADIRAADDGSDRAAVVDLAVEDERLRARVLAADRDPADDRQTRILQVERFEKPGRREAERVDQERHDVSARERRQLESSVFVDRDVERLDLGAGQGRCPDGDARPFLQLAIPAQDALRDTADEMSRSKLVGHDRRRRRRVVQVVLREEDECKVDRRTGQLAERLPRGLRGGGARIQRGRDSRSDSRHRAFAFLAASRVNEPGAMPASAAAAR
jgi:hypothetical protein